MRILSSLLSDLGSAASIAASVTWWVATYLGIQLSRYRYEPEAPAFKRRWEVSMLVFVALLGFAVAANGLSTWLGK